MSDYHKRFNFLGEMFPNQFRTIPGIIIWTLVFILDVAIVFWVAHLLGVPLPIGGSWGKIGLILYLAVAFGLFCLESFLYNLIRHS